MTLKLISVFFVSIRAPVMGDMIERRYYKPKTAEIRAKCVEWLSKSRKHMFPYDVLKELFRGKLSFFKQNRIAFAKSVYKKKWAARIDAAGDGAPALKYLSRYLNKGVIQDKNILSNIDGVITFQYFDSQDKRWKTRSVMLCCA